MRSIIACKVNIQYTIYNIQYKYNISWYMLYFLYNTRYRHSKYKINSRIFTTNHERGLNFGLLH